jgi:hypothetical protein
MRYLLRPLTDRQVDQAFPLIQLAAPELCLERWRAFARSLTGGARGRRPAEGQGPAEAGIMTAQDSSSYIYGLFCYRIHEDLLSDRALDVSHFCVCSLLDPAGVTEALLEGIDSLGGRLGCTGILVELSEDAGALMNCRPIFLERFQRFGHRVDGLRFSRRGGTDAPSVA